MNHFHSLLQAVAAHRHSPHTLCDDCIGHLTEAANLGHSRFLAGFSLADAPEFDIWQTTQSESLQRELSATLEQLAHVYGHSGRRQYARAVEYARRWLALDPLHEPAHRMLMRLHVCAGNRSAALEQYQECARILNAELGVPPDSDTHTLFQQIRSGALPDLAENAHAVEAVRVEHLIHTQPPAKTPDAEGVHHLPHQPTSFIGRARELDQIANRLADPACRLLTVTGPGGMGKTRLVIEAANHQVGRFAHGVWFVDLTPVASADMLPALLLRNLETPDASAADPRKQLFASMHNKEILLVLDNIEHLPESASLVSDLLAAAPGLKVLATGRARFNLREEWLEPLQGLVAPPTDETRLNNELPSIDDPLAQRSIELEEYDATRLFLACTRRLQPDFQPTCAEAQAIVHICRLVEGMPLAIELAAAWMPILPISDLVKEVEHGLRKLSTAIHDIPVRHRSMDAVFDHSWGMLNQRQQTVLRQLAVFRGGWTRAAAEAVANASFTDLAELVDRSWLRVRGAERYDMHELVRQYCEQRLECDPPADATANNDAGQRPVDVARARHVAYYGDFLRQQTYKINYRQEVMGDIMAEFGNLHLAWRWSIEHGDMTIATDMVISLYFIGEMLGWYRFVLQSYQPAIVTLESILDSVTAPVDRRREAAAILSWIHFASASLSLALGLIGQARVHMARCYTIAQMIEPADRRSEMFMICDHMTAWIEFTEGEFAQVQTRCSQLLEQFSHSNVDFTLYGNARGIKFWQAHLHAMRARTWADQGEYGCAQDAFRLALAMRQEMGEQRFRAINTTEFARVLLLVGDYERAATLAQEALQLSQSVGDQIGVALAHHVLGLAHAAQGQSVLATTHFNQSLVVGRRSGHLYLQVNSLIGLGNVELALDHPEEAQRCFQSAIHVLAPLETAYHRRVIGALLGLGWAASASHDTHDATKMFVQALEATGRSAWETLDALLGMAHVFAQTGQTECAVSLAALIAGSPRSAHKTRQRAQNLLVEMEDKLSATVFAQQCARGKKWQPEEVAAELVASAAKLSQRGQAGILVESA